MCDVVRCGDVYEFWYVAWFSHYSYQLDAYIALLPHKYRACKFIYQYRKGKPNRLYRHRQCLRDRCEVLLLPRPRLRWTAMWAFPSNIAQRLAFGRPLAGNYFFSSLMFDDNPYLSVAVCLAHWCGGVGHHGILAKKAWRRGV